jgi:hypothetical protein
MFKAITFSESPTDSAFGYETHLPSLQGKTYEFKQGLNVIVGKNGCGKTALLNVIRKLTFCDGTYSSDFVRGHGEYMLHRKNNYECGYWQDAKLVGDYTYSVWNLRKNEDVAEYDWCSSSENLAQRFGEKDLSAGQQVYRSLLMMMAYMMFGYENTSEQKVENGKDARDFKKCALDVIEREYERQKKTSRGKGDGWHDMFEAMRDYYAENSVEGFKGITMLLDEPDKGMDVFNVKEMYDFLVHHGDFEKNGMQVICVLHNIGMIHRLKALGTANFIEMSDGYIDEVEKFFDE